MKRTLTSRLFRASGALLLLANIIVDTTMV